MNQPTSPGSNDPINEVELRGYRLQRIRNLLTQADLGGLVICDPVNLRYATGSRNMQVWTMHNMCRYAFISSDGPCVLFDLPSSAHLNHGLETIDEVRPSLAFDYMMVGPRAHEMAKRWAREIADLLNSYGAGNKRLGIDRADLLATEALRALGVNPQDGKGILEQARAIKSLEEIRALRTSLRSCEDGLQVLRDRLQPGMRENEALALLLSESVSRGGEYPETRLLTSGPRTNPWFQETSDRVMQAGDLLSFDTDLIGPMGFYNDISRSWLVGDARPSDEQRHLYDIARRQLEHNIALLRPGIGFMEYAEHTFPLPDDYLRNRYADVAHGCGLGVEYPLIWYPEDKDWGAYDGVFEANMVICVECYVGAVGGREGVKLEQPVWISEDGPVVLATTPLEDDFA